MKTRIRNLLRFSGAIACAAGLASACVLSEGDGSESHFFECEVDADCAHLRPRQVCVENLCQPQGHRLEPAGTSSPGGAAGTAGDAGEAGSGGESGAGGTITGERDAGADVSPVDEDGGLVAPDASGPDASVADAGMPDVIAEAAADPDANGEDAGSDAADGAAMCGELGRLVEIDLGKPPDGTVYPYDLVEGPDGNMWVTTFTTYPGGTFTEVVRITPDGEMTRFPAPPGGAITVGSDGNLWLASATTISRVTLTGDFTSFPVPSVRGGADIYDITPGPDGALWFTEYGDNQIGRITTDGTITEFTLPFPTVVNPDDPEVVGAFGITTGPDGNLWFSETAVDKVGVLTPGGVLTEYDLTSPLFLDLQPIAIVSGPDGNIWVTQNYPATVASMSTDGTLLTDVPVFGLVREYPQGLTVGTDGNVWAGTIGSGIVRITPDGEVTACSVPTQCCETPYTGAITAASDGKIWFNEFYYGRVAYIVPSTP